MLKLREIQEGGEIGKTFEGTLEETKIRSRYSAK